MKRARPVEQVVSTRVSAGDFVPSPPPTARYVLIWHIVRRRPTRAVVMARSWCTFWLTTPPWQPMATPAANAPHRPSSQVERVIMTSCVSTVHATKYIQHFFSTTATSTDRHGCAHISGTRPAPGFEPWEMFQTPPPPSPERVWAEGACFAFGMMTWSCRQGRSAGQDLERKISPLHLHPLG